MTELWYNLFWSNLGPSPTIFACISKQIKAQFEICAPSQLLDIYSKGRLQQHMVTALQFGAFLFTVQEQQGQTLFLSVLGCCRLRGFSSCTFLLGEHDGTDLMGVNAKMKAAHFLCVVRVNLWSWIQRQARSTEQPSALTVLTVILVDGVK